jgi:outer membrane biosynthesis protein TonB
MIIKDSFEARGIRTTRAAPPLTRDQPRLTIALLLSLLFHALLLSLQFGIPGLGLPGLQMPWDERRALAPALTVRIVGANRAAGAAATSTATEAPPPAPSEKSRSLPSSQNPAAPHSGITLMRSVEKTTNNTPLREVRKSARVAVKRSRKAAAPPRHHRRKSAPAKPHPRIIAKKQPVPDAFTVPVAPDDELSGQGQIAHTQEQAAPPSAAVEPNNEALAFLREEEGVEKERAIEAQHLAEENARRQALELEAQRQAEQIAQQQAAAHRLEEEARQQARQIEAQELEQENAKRQAEELEARKEAEQQAEQMARQLEEENLARARQIEADKLAEENARRQALALEAQRQAEQLAQQQAAQQLDEENLRRASQLEARRREEETARHQAMELEARRQAEQLAQQQAAQLQEETLQRARQIEAQRQEEEIARRQAEELEARRQAEQMARQQAAQQREEENLRRERETEVARLAQENARREAAELDARRQGEESAARQAAAQARQLQEGDVATTGNTQGQVLGGNARAVAENSPGGLADAAGDRPGASNSGASGTQPKGGTSADADDGPILLSDSDLASFKVAQVRKVDATRLDARAAQELAVAQDSRRRTIFGSADDDIVLKMYIDSWRQAVERNGNPDQAQPPLRGDADVTVVLRSDGSIESITINRSDERHVLDEPVRRIARSSGRYDAFPPDLLRRYDVIEIRRIWRFGDKLQILEQGR